MRQSENSQFSFVERRRWLEEAAADVCDVLIVGGGITGAGVAREAALRGLGAVLLERRDFASGTSSRSSKLIHGGLRYLAQGDVALVREAARERSTLRRIAPHLATPLQMLIPASSRPGRMKLAAGLWTFEKLAGDAEDAGYRVLDAQAVREAEPLLGAKPSRGGGIVFTEYATNDARLVLETLQSAVNAGARVANYAEVTALDFDATGVRASVFDTLSGETLDVRARAVVNAGGPWFDAINSLVDSGATPATQLTKGIHVVVPRERLPVRHLVVLRAPDGRSTFAVPSGDSVYLGTTDTLYSGDPEEPAIESADVDYVLESVAATLGVTLRRDDIVGSWSGVRPLLRQEGKSASEISRRDEIRIGPGPVVAIAGGKLTTYRRMAERVVDAVAGLVRVDGVEAGGLSARLPLSGGSADDQARARTEHPTRVDPDFDERMWSTYGLHARAILDRIGVQASLAEPIDGLSDLTAAEIDHAVHAEMAMTLDDVLRRRSRVGMYRTRHACDAAAQVAARMGAALGWDQGSMDRQVGEFCARGNDELSIVRGESTEENT